MKLLRNIALACALTISALFGGSAQARDFLAKSLSVSDGLSQNTVCSIFRDSRGFLWIGTLYGLNRYDNYTLKQYYTTSGPDAIKENDVVNMFEDNLGRIWVLGQAHTSIYNPLTEKFTELMLDGKEVKATAHMFVDDGIILGGRGRLLKYDFATETIKELPTKGGSEQTIKRIHKLGNGMFMLQTRWDGLWIWNPANGNTSRHKTITDMSVMSSAIDEAGNIWLGLGEEGVKKFSPQGTLLRHYTEADGLASDLVTDVLINGDDILIASEKGLDLIDLHTGQVKLGGIGGHEDKFGSIKRLYIDRYGNAYVGTVRNGLKIMHSVTMRTFRLNPPGTAESTVTSIIKGKGNEILCGVDGYGIVALNPATDAVRHIKATSGMKVTSLINWPGNKIMFSDYGYGLHILDKATETVSEVPAYLADVIRSSHERAMSVDLYSAGKDKIALVTDSIYLIDPAKHTVTPFKSDNVLKGKLVPIHADSTQILARRLDVLYRADIATMSIKPLTRLPDENTIVCAKFDGKHSVYLTSRDVIYRYDMKAGNLSLVNESNDIIQNIMSIIPDGNKLWVGASNRLFVIDNDRIISFDEGDGVIPNEFITAATYSDSTYLYFGGTNGLARINRAETDSLARHRAGTVRINLGEIYINGVSSMAQVASGEVKVPSRNASISLRVVTDEMRPLRSKMFRFYFEGANIDRPFETLQPTVTINELPSGAKVKVRVSCSLGDGTWTPPTPLVTLAVEQVWYKSWWFITLLIVAIAALLYIAWRVVKQRWRMAADRHHQHQLERDIEVLANINEGLRTPIAKVAEPLQNALDGLDSDKELNRDALADELRRAMVNIENMHDLVNSPFEMLHPQNMGLSSMMLTARFNMWLYEQSESFVNSLKHSRRIKLEFIPEYDPGAITFNASRMEVIVNSLLNALFENGDRELHIGVTEDEKSDQLIASFTGSKKHLPEPDAMQPDNEPLRVVYSRWLCELDGLKLVTEVDDSGHLTGALLYLPVERTHKQGSRTKSYFVEDEMGNLHEMEEDADNLSTSMVLVAVSDTETSRYIMSAAEREFGVALRSSDISTALETVKRELPDIVVTDSSPGSIDGVELCRLIKKDSATSSIDVIMLTSGNVNRFKETAFRYGADAYLEKPFDINVLLDMCRSMLAKK